MKTQDLGETSRVVTENEGGRKNSPTPSTVSSGFVRMPIISLWLPWANWVMLGWKPIETRTHKRFASLAGKYIGIHAAAHWDKNWPTLARPYLTPHQIERTSGFMKVGGAIIGRAFVSQFYELTERDSAGALIDCGSVKRYGLVLQNVHPIPAIPCRGRQGIWYYDVPQEDPATTVGESLAGSSNSPEKGSR